MGDERLLELRIHGVNNTAPVNLLYAIEEEYGDALTGVYSQRETEGPRVKAYSWGGLARISASPRIPFANWLGSVTSAAWIAVIPFGLANVAYWSRRLVMPGRRLDEVRNTAALSRIFSLGLTLLFVASICSVSLNMTEARVRAEADLPQWISWLKTLEPGVRTAIFSLLPVIAIMFLRYLANKTRTLYDKGHEVEGPPATATTENGLVASQETWKFATKSFWDNADLSKHNAQLHTAAGVALSLVWTGQFWLPASAFFGWAIIVIATLVIVGCGWLIRRMPLATEGGISDRRKLLANRLYQGIFVVFLVQLVALAVAGHRGADKQHLVGLSLIPGVLVFGLLLLAVSALGWRVREKHSYWVAWLLLGLGIAAVVAHQWWKSRGIDMTLLDVTLVGVILAVGGVWVWLVYKRGPDDEERRAQAWRGTAPGVLMIVSLFAAVLLSTVFVMVAAALMGDGSPRMSDTELMTVSPIYLSFTVMITAVLGALLVVLIYVVWRVVGHCTHPVEPALDATTVPDKGEIRELAPYFATAQPTPRLATRFGLGRMWTLEWRHCLTRRIASLAHRAERIAAVLAAVAAAGLCLALALALMLHDRVIVDNAELIGIRNAGVKAALVLGLAVVGAGAARSRPLGIVWDLICFLPRAAHPFGPPCYAQKAVPELHDYCTAWLDKPPAAEGGTPERRLILSAHSLGGVLAVATILLLEQRFRGRVALITYGCQLRAYFGRIFPELLGPKVLGVTDSSPAQLTGCPTFPTAPSPAHVLGGAPSSVHDILTSKAGSLWVNLWRPTDYLGFPVYSREPGNGIDVPADEVTPEVAQDGDIDKTPPVHFVAKTTVRIDTHSDYFRAQQYGREIGHLVERLNAR